MMQEKQFWKQAINAVFKIVYFVVFNLCFYPQLSAQSLYEVQHVGVPEGLTQNSVYTITQDSIGFLWVGTFDGLNRFDGYSVKGFRFKDNDPLTLRNNTVRILFRDHKENIWVGTGYGLSLYNKQFGDFDHFVHDVNNPNSISNSDITAMDEDEEGYLWVGTKKGINKFNAELRTFEKYGIGTLNQENAPISAVCAERGGYIWYSTGSEIYRLNALSGKIDPMFLPESQFNPSAINDLFISKVGDLWAATDKGVYQYDKLISKWKKVNIFFEEDYQKHQQVDISNTGINSFCEDEYGRLWLAGQDGVGRYNTLNKNFVCRKIGKEPGNCFSIFCDNVGVLWVGTENEGIYGFETMERWFKQVNNAYVGDNKLCSNIIWSFEEFDNKLWIGTENGLSMQDLSNGKVANFFYSPSKPNGLIGSDIRCLMTDSKGDLWIGNRGLSRLKSYDLDGNIVLENYKHNPNDPKTISSPKARCLLEDSFNMLWFGTEDGLNRRIVTPSGETYFQRYSFKDTIEYASDRILCMYEDERKRLWFGTETGLIVAYRGDEGSIKRFELIRQRETVNVKSNIPYRVNSIMQDKKGRFWVATSLGLLRFDPEKKTFKGLGEKLPFTNVNCYGIRVDRTGSLWISSNIGLFKIDPDAEEGVQYDQHDGLQSNEFNWGAHYKSSTGEMFFGGINGFNSFHPDKLHNRELTPSVIITKFYLMNKVMYPKGYKNQFSPLDKDITLTKEITLNHKQNAISFEFAALQFVHSEKKKYSYLLENYDPDWMEVGSRNFANYSDLPPGTYIFKVRAASRDGKWNPDPTELKITITAPYYSTMYFKVGVALLLIGLGYTWYKSLLIRNEQQRKSLEKLILKRTEEKDQQIAQVEEQAKKLSEQQKVLTQTLDNLEHLSTIGREITSHLKSSDIAMRTYDFVNTLMDATGFGIAVYNDQLHRIEFSGYVEKGEQSSNIIHQLNPKKHLSAWCFINEKPILIKDFENEYKLYSPELDISKETELPHSMLYLPLMMKDKAIGVIMVLSYTKNAYSEYELNLLKNIAVYASIALSNARSFSDILASTNLFYRYLNPSSGSDSERDGIQTLQIVQTLSTIRSGRTLIEVINKTEEDVFLSVSENNTLLLNVLATIDAVLRYVPSPLLSGIDINISKLANTFYVDIHLKTDDFLDDRIVPECIFNFSTETYTHTRIHQLIKEHFERTFLFHNEFKPISIVLEANTLINKNI